MEKIIRAIEFGGEVNVFIGDIFDQIIEGIEFLEEFYASIRKYAHEHPDETDKINYEIKLSNSFTIDPLEPSDE